MYYFQPVTSGLRKLNNESDLLQYSLQGKKPKKRKNPKNQKQTTNQTQIIRSSFVESRSFLQLYSLDENFVKSILKLSILSGDGSKGFKEPTNN